MAQRTAPKQTSPSTFPDADLNANVAAILLDMSHAQRSRDRQRAYTQAATAVFSLENPLDRLMAASGELPPIAHLGPSSRRIVLEVLAGGRSPTVDRAVAESGLAAEIRKRQGLRSNFLSRAFAAAILEHAPVVTLRGDLQMHSTWSDGTQTLDDIVQGCLARGYTYAAVTDHSVGLPVANGLSISRLAAQAREIEDVNARYGKRFRLLRGVEANIRPDGGVDVPIEQRRLLDIVVAAPHSGLREQTRQTSRMIDAVRAPGVHVLGHPRGRKHDARLGVIADWRAVFAAAAENRIAIEIDGDPARQDLDFELAAQALAAGCLFALDSDAHSAAELAYTDLARAHAVVAGIPADRIVNCWPLDRLLAWAGERRARPT